MTSSCTCIFMHPGPLLLLLTSAPMHPSTAMSVWSTTLPTGPSHLNSHSVHCLTSSPLIRCSSLPYLSKFLFPPTYSEVSLASLTTALQITLELIYLPYLLPRRTALKSKILTFTSLHYTVYRPYESIMVKSDILDAGPPSPGTTYIIPFHPFTSYFPSKTFYCISSFNAPLIFFAPSTSLLNWAYHTLSPDQ